MKISIVTPSWNQAAFIVDAVESVRRQNDHGVEHIVFDNRSTDGSIDILKRYPQVTLIVEPDKGQSDALNKGFRKASGDLIGWLNIDDRYSPDCFRTVRKTFEDHPDCDIVYGDYRLIDREGNVICKRMELPFDPFMLKYLHILCIPSTTVFFRRRIFEEGNFLDPDYHYSMDYEFFLRLALKGYRFRYIPHILADFRTYPDSKSQKQTLKQKQELEAALLKHDPFLAGLKDPWRKIIRQVFMMAARLKRSILKLFRGAYFA